MVAKKVKKVVPIVYREFFKTEEGKLIPTSTVASLQGTLCIYLYVHF